MATCQPAIFNDMGKYQWYVHLSRGDGSDLGAIKSAVSDCRSNCDAQGINLVVGLGPTLLADLTDDTPGDFQPYHTVESIDGSGREAKDTQEELLLWMTHDEKDVVWKAQWDARMALIAAGMSVARETPTFIYGESLDMTGFIDGTGNPEDEDQPAVAIRPDGEAGAGGSFIIAQRWVHDLVAWEKQDVPTQEVNFGRTKADSTRLDEQAPHSHLSHVELRDGDTADDSKPKRDEIARRSTPYAFHDGTVGLYFMAFCKTQAPFRERMDAMYGRNGEVRDMLTDFSNPASGSYYFAPSVECLDSSLA